MRDSGQQFNSISFLVISPHGDAVRNFEWCETHPMSGSETAALRMADSFQKMGYQVRLLTSLEEVRHHRCDVFISLRNPEVFLEHTLPGRLNYLWGQDDSDQPVLQVLNNPVKAERIFAACSGVLLLSHYQTQRWMMAFHLPLEKTILTTNGVALERFSVVRANLARRPKAAYYASAPFRGLKVLLHAWPAIVAQVPEAQLHILSSMLMYRGQESPEYLSYYEQLSSMPGVVYHGSTGQARLRAIAQECRALAYPCFFPETSCIAAMEAMASGCVVVSTLTGALPETAWKNPLVPIVDGWYEQWVAQVVRVMVDDEYYCETAGRNLDIIRYNDWQTIARQWLGKFERDWAAPA